MTYCAFLLIYDNVFVLVIYTNLNIIKVHFLSQKIDQDCIKYTWHLGVGSYNLITILRFTILALLFNPTWDHNPDNLAYKLFDKLIYKLYSYQINE